MIRRATSEDTDEIARIFVAARDRMTYLPRMPDEDRTGFGAWIIGRHEVWVAEDLGRVAGFAALSTGMLDHIYMDPDAQNRGLGSLLLGTVKARLPDGFQLWVFQKNEGARRFYERHGLRLLELTDGEDNMEREPDALYEWRPS
jgi:GNAT superfamily N-acetyltransferase